MTLGSLLADIVARLDAAGIPYMVTGSVAGAFHGEPRMTLDIDLVIDPTRQRLLQFVADLVAAGYYADLDVARQALDDRTQFNAVSPDSSKVDFMIRKDRPFSLAEFGRRIRAELLGTTADLTTAEDLVLAKLEWAAATGSDRQLRDIAGIVAISTEMDTQYIDRWADVLGVSEVWAGIKGDR